MNGSHKASLNLVLDVGKVFCLLLVGSVQLRLVCLVYLLNLVKVMDRVELFDQNLCLGCIE